MKPRTQRQRFCGIQEANEKGFEGYFSVGEVDRSKEMIRPDGFKKWINTYLSNPVVFPSHIKVQPTGKPTQIAKCIACDIDDVGPYGEFEFVPGEMSDQWRPLITSKAVTGLSHRFLDHDKFHMERTPTHGLVTVFDEVEVLEVSVEPIPANRMTLAGMRGKGMDELIDSICKSMDVEEHVKTAVTKLTEKTMLGLGMIAEQIEALNERLKGFLNRDQIEEIFDGLKCEILDPDGAYGRALSNRAGTGADMDIESGSEVLKELDAKLRNIAAK